MLFSIVIPVYSAEKCLKTLCERLYQALEPVTPHYEIILVEDRSRDESWKQIIALGQQDKRIKGIRFSRNFGQHCAITAGLAQSKGEFVIVMDCDLQDDPQYIPSLYQKALEGYEIVYTRKKKREHPLLKNFFSHLFSRLFNWLSEGNTVTRPDVGAYSLIHRKVVEAFCQFKDSHRHYLLLLQCLGFNSAIVEVIHGKSQRGGSSYTFRRLLQLSIDGIVSQSHKLLYLSISIGFVFCMIAMASIIYLVVMYFVHGFKEGWASTMVLMLFSTGVILMSLGILGIYIGKIFDQVKQRPLYIIDEKINL